MHLYFHLLLLFYPFKCDVLFLQKASQTNVKLVFFQLRLLLVYSTQTSPPYIWKICIKQFLQPYFIKFESEISNCNDETWNFFKCDWNELAPIVPSVIGNKIHSIKITKWFIQFSLYYSLIFTSIFISYLLLCY